MHYGWIQNPVITSQVEGDKQFHLKKIYKKRFHILIELFILRN